MAEKVTARLQRLERKAERLAKRLEKAERRLARIHGEADSPIGFRFQQGEHWVGRTPIE